MIRLECMFIGSNLVGSTWNTSIQRKIPNVRRVFFQHLPDSIISSSFTDMQGLLN